MAWADRLYEPVDRVVGQPDASVTVGGAKRVLEARAAAAVNRDGSVTSVELLQRIAVGG